MEVAIHAPVSGGIGNYIMWLSPGKIFQDPSHAIFASGEETPRMLIADDDPSVLKVLADRYVRAGFNVQTATNGINALLAVSRGRPHTLLIDLNMPEVDGLSVCAHLLEPDRAPLNVIVITGSRDLDALERCEGLGAYYVRKGPNFWSDLEAVLVEIHPQMARRIQQSGTPAPIRMSPCVLLIDDDNDTLLFLASRLQNRGLEVRLASDVQQGLRAACSENPVVIVTDNFMPNGDAQYLLTRLRTTAVTANIPVIVLSGRRLDEATERNLRRDICGRPGATAVLTKSQDTYVLFEALKQFCGFEKEHLVPTTGNLA